MKWVKDKAGYYRKQTIFEWFKELPVKQKIKIILVLAIVLFCTYKIIDTTSLHFVQAKAEYYICKKYDINKNELELVDYRHSGIYWDDRYFFQPEWCDFAFEYKHNDLMFNINRIHGRFYDDYQLDKVQQLCTSWLQNNIDKRIAGFNLSSYSLIKFCQINNKPKYYIFNESDIPLFFESYHDTYDNKKIIIFFEDENLKNSKNEIFLLERDTLNNLFNKKFPDKEVNFRMLNEPFHKGSDSCDESWWIYSINPY